MLNKKEIKQLAKRIWKNEQIINNENMSQDLKDKARQKTINIISKLDFDDMLLLDDYIFTKLKN